jgi:uncharacterized SAM-binding protein YcdF (DUF218 family)
MNVDRPRRSRHVLRDLLTVGLLAVVGAAAITGYAVFRIEQQGQQDERRPAGAIVVLGAAQYNGRPSGVFSARLDHAVALYIAGLAPYLVVTGGKLPGDVTTEAAVARAYALQRGVPADHILMEDQGRSTLESLTAVAAILRSRDIPDALFVSDRTHMLRVLRMAHDQGITAYGSPTTTSPSDVDPDLRVSATLHELGGLALYFLAGSESAGDFGPGDAANAATGSAQP